MSSIPKYAQLKQEIISWINSAKYKPNQQLPSEHEMAEQFGFSRQTVRQALGELVQEGWLHRTQGKGTFVSDVAAAERKSADGQTIALITTYISDYIFPTIVRGVESSLRAQGYQLLLSSTDNEKERERESLELMMRQGISGLIIEPTKSAEGNPNFNYFLSLDNQRIPYVMLHEKYNDLDCPVVRLDDQAGGYKAAEHLLKLGHRRIVGMFKVDDMQGVHRMKGFVQAHREHEVALQTEYLVRYRTEEKYTFPAAKLRELLAQDERPTAIVCYNDELAIQLLQVLREQQLQVPDDISIVGFDDATLATATEVQLTTLKHPKEEMGAAAVEMLLSCMDNKTVVHDRVFMPELIVRQSTRAL